MKIRFRCNECKVEPEVEVPARSQAVDVRLYFERIVMQKVGTAHMVISPNCPAQQFDLLIPIEEDKVIGAETKATKAGQPLPTFDKLKDLKEASTTEEGKAEE